MTTEIDHDSLAKFLFNRFEERWIEFEENVKKTVEKIIAEELAKR